MSLITARLQYCCPINGRWYTIGPQDYQVAPVAELAARPGRLVISVKCEVNCLCGLTHSIDLTPGEV